VFLKVAPDLEDGEVEAIADTVAANGFDGIIVSNTTIARPEPALGPRARWAACPARPWPEPSTAVLALPRRRRAGRADRGRRRRLRRRGLRQDPGRRPSRAALFGPGLRAAPVWSSASRELAARLRADGFACVEDAVGAA
jgi:dihydroorotate dehydrogenase